MGLHLVGHLFLSMPYINCGVNFFMGIIDVTSVLGTAKSVYAPYGIGMPACGLKRPTAQIT